MAFVVLRSPSGAAVLKSLRRRMQRNVMENGKDPHPLQVIDQAGSLFERAGENEKDVGIEFPRWVKRKANKPHFLKGLQQPIVARVQAFSGGDNFFCFFQLGVKESTDQLARQVRGADINPRVLVHLPPEKLSAVGPLFSYDLSAYYHVRVVY